MDGIDAATKTALGLGAFGSLLGLLNLGLKGIEVWRDRPRLSLKITHARGPIGHSAGVTPRDYVVVVVANRGRRPLYVTSAGVLSEDKTWVPFMTDLNEVFAFPATLDERHPEMSLSRPKEAVQEFYTRPGQARPTHIVCEAGGRQHRHRVSRREISLLTGRQ